MDAALLNPSRFLKSQAFAGREPCFTIKAVRIEELEGVDGKKKVKGIISFADVAKEWVLNRTVVECLKAMWGRETDDWHGKRVVLYAAPFHDNTTGENTTCIRVRGSPDIAATLTVTISLPRKKPFQVQLLKTNGKAAPKGKANGKAAAAPEANGAPTPEEQADILASEAAAAQAEGFD